MRLSVGRVPRPTRTPMIALLSGVLLLLVTAGTALGQPGNGQSSEKKTMSATSPGRRTRRPWRSPPRRSLAIWTTVTSTARAPTT